MAVTYRAEVVIDAPVASVWGVLVDLPSYGSWNPFTTEVCSTLAVGDPVQMRVAMPGRWTMQQIEYVTVVEAGHRLGWGIRTRTPWLLWAERVQTLRAEGEGTRYVTEDSIGGLLWPLVALLFGGPLRRGFAGVAAGLKTWVERAHT